MDKTSYMTVFKRAVLYVWRKRSRTITLFIIFLCVSTLILSGFTILDASEDTSKELRESTGSGFTLKQNLANASKKQLKSGSYMLEQDGISEKMLRDIALIDGIKGYNAKSNSIPDLQDDQKKGRSTIVFSDMFATDPFLKNAVSAQGSIDSSYDSFFTERKFALTEGRHINKNDKNKIIISNELAKKYNYKIGDTLYLGISDALADAEKAEGFKVEKNSVGFEIVGLFDIKTEQTDSAYSQFFGGEDAAGGKELMSQYELYENYMFCDMNGFKDIWSTYPSMHEQYSAGFADADFFVSDPKNLDNILAQVKKIKSVDWKNFEINVNDEVYQAASGSMNNVEKLVTTMIAAVIILATGIITLILSMWVKSRKKEAGVLMSVGITKGNIILQYLVETIVIALFAFGLTYITGNFVSGILARIINASISPESVAVTMGHFKMTCLLTSLSILVAVVISSLPILRLQPRKILSTAE